MCRSLREQARSHRDLGWAEDCGLAPDHCGSELARESGVTGDDEVDCAGAFAGKPAPTGILVALKIVTLPRTIVGASLLAKAVCHSMWMYLIWPLREQARSHRDFEWAEDCGLAPDHCGSEPARESGVSGNGDVEYADAFASKLAPTGIWVGLKIVALPRTIVGASLLAKAVGQAMMMLNLPTPSRASPLPQRFGSG